MVDMFGILSPVSELVWALEVLSSPVLMSLSVDYTEKNKRVIFSVQQLQLKQQRKKKIAEFFLPFPNLHVSQLRSSQPSE